MAGKEGEDGGLLARRREFLDTYFRKGAEFAQELLHDNEALRYRLLQLEEELGAARSTAPPSATVRQLLERIEQLEREKESLLGRFAEIELQGRDFTERYHQIERENNDLANLYIASSQLQAALDVRELCATIIEILLNFVGAKIFALMFFEAGDGALGALVSEGIPVTQVPRVPRGEGIIGRVAQSGHAYHEGAPRPPALDLAHPAVCIPLRLRDRVVGVVPIWGYLTQKEGLVDVDFQLFDLLSLHAAPALNAARLARGPSDGRLGLADLRACLEETA
ncbi:MAG: GAF domain-containing protein [Deltaproteobacteria bacterium]|nr:GAF domain-containing protein [Deltaproteobacteria bacterium]